MRTVGSNKDTTWPVIREAAIGLIYEHGFESMNMRQLAESVNMKQGSVYYYFKSKEELLFRLVTELLEEIVADLELNLQDVSDPLDQLDTFVARLVEWHVTRHQETFIARMEIRSLSRDKHESYMKLRDRYDQLLDEILRSCADSSLIDDASRSLNRVSIMTMITGITSWYHPDGPVTLDGFKDFYVTAVRRLVAAPPHTE
jgi:AcrR family transcriptional regulator